jgi:hypothetical protein
MDRRRNRWLLTPMVLAAVATGWLALQAAPGNGRFGTNCPKCSDACVAGQPFTVWCVDRALHLTWAATFECCCCVGGGKTRSYNPL